MSASDVATTKTQLPLVVPQDNTGDSYEIDIAGTDLSFDRPRRVASIVIFLAFGVFGMWATFVPMQSAAVGQGIVAVESNRKVVQHLEGGIVERLHIREGDVVSEGQLLVTLDDTHDKAQLEIIMGKYLVALALEARLVAERKGLDEVIFPSVLQDSGDIRSVEAMAGQSTVFSARKMSREGEVELLTQRIDQYSTRITGLKAIKQGKLEQIESYQEESQELEELLEDGYADKQHLREIRRVRARLRSEVSELDSSVIGTEIEIGEAKMQILQVQRQFQSGVATELSGVREQLFDLQERKNALTDRVERREIRSPSHGIVLDLAFHTLGAVVAAGEPLLYIIPQADRLIIDAKLQPQDIDALHVGQDAIMRFTSFSRREVPVIHGKLVRIAADVLSDEVSGQAYFSARIEVADRGQQELDRLQLQLQPGMPVAVLVQTGERTLLEYMIQPVSNAFSQALIED